MLYSKSLAVLGGALSLALAAPATNSLHRRGGLAESACANPVDGLSQAACKIMAGMQFLGMGKNANSGQMAIGNQGPNTFTFTNGGSDEATIVGWTMAPGSYISMFMNAAPAAVTYTLKKGESVTVSLANGVSGSFSGLYHDTKMVNGQVSETWLEFTTGNSATIDVSREVNMNGRPMSAVVKGSGCKSDMNTCVFKCNSGSTCGEAGSYQLINCAPGSQNGANYGLDAGQASGGCTGFSNGGHVDVVLNGDGSAVPSQPSPTPSPEPPKSSPTPPAPSPIKMLQVVSTSAAPTPTPTPTDNPMAVVALPGDKTLHEFSLAAYKAFGKSS